MSGCLVVLIITLLSVSLHGQQQQCGIGCNLCSYPYGSQNSASLTCTQCMMNYYLAPVTQSTGSNSPFNMCLPCLNSTFSLQGSTTCTPCQSLCLTCNYSASSCQSCIDGAYLNGTTCIACPNGTYIEGNTCLPCASSCRKCSIIASNCLSCNDGYYAYQSLCFACPTYCTVCKDSTSCSSCVSAAYLNGTNCVTCPNGTFFGGNIGVNSCVVCSLDCKTCNSTNCFSCLDGYYPRGLYCIPCQSTCTSCNSTASSPNSLRSLFTNLFKLHQRYLLYLSLLFLCKWTLMSALSPLLQIL